MCERMATRGPDGHGIWRSADGRVVLGHRRLAIIDLSERGAQPMSIDNGALVITFNGEIYNFHSLRSQLEAKGRRFVSDSDTEVLLRLYREHGEAMVGKLRGMFAFAIWDDTRHGVFLARDPFGIKPLYYSFSGGVLRVASEVKALRTVRGLDLTPEPAAHVGYFVWGHVPEPYTLYRGIRALPAGTSLWVGSDGTTRHTVHSSISEMLGDQQSAVRSSQRSDASEVLSSLLEDSVRAHMIADVDVGVFLSAGRDSASLAALAARTHERLRTVTLGFEEFRGGTNDEVPLAEATAARIGSDQHTAWITRQQFEAEHDRLFDRMDQPTIDGVNTYFVSKVTAESGLKVALSGLGSDELLGGYPSFAQLPRLTAIVNAIPFAGAIGRGMRVMSSPLLKHMTSPKYAGILEYGGDLGGGYMLRRGLFMPWELPALLDAEMIKEGWNELQPRMRLNATAASTHINHLRIAALEATWYMRNQLLRDTDWASMSHSLEVRVPFVDLDLWRGVRTLIAAGHRVSKDMMVECVRSSLPSAIATRAKTGFRVPVRDWLAQRNGTYKGRGLRGWAKYVYTASTTGDA